MWPFAANSDSGLPGASRCACPTNSSRRVGRIRAASGSLSGLRSDIADQIDVRRDGELEFVWVQRSVDLYVLEVDVGELAQRIDDLDLRQPLRAESHAYLGVGRI